MATNDQILPQKEQGLFKQVVKYYETKQYKKGLKAAELILKKFPEHGETLSMKGLTLNGLDKKTEAYELVRKGLKNDLRSHVCWHVYGLLHRSDRNYAEAIKCYLNAMRLDKDNYQIMRDLALLQGQIRDLQGFVDTRYQMLSLKATNKTNWIGFAIAHHLNGSHEVAVNVLDSYESTVDVKSEDRYEYSELLMYKAMILEEGGKFDECLAFMDKERASIVDRLALRETRGRIYLKMGRNSEAEAEYRGLIDSNIENTKYHDGLRQSLGLGLEELTDAARTKLAALYTSYQEKFPKANAPRRIPLDFLAGAEFEAALAQYIQMPLKKGIPSLYSDLKPLYADKDKAAALGRVIEGAEKSLKSSKKFPGGSDPCDEETVMWATALLAQHYDRVGEHSKALAIIDDAIKQSPETVDTYLFKARVLKHCGDAVGAAAMANKGRKMDLADRYLNSICTKRMLRADQVAEAETTVMLFTKDGDNMNNLYDMQCMWYEIEYGNSQMRQKCYGKALKKYLAVAKHFDDIEEDQFDFHSYCLRKMTLRAYVKMLRMEDTLYSHHFFTRAMEGAVRCYLALHDCPPGKAAAAAEEEAMKDMTPAERKKYKSKLRKLEAQTKRREEEEAAAREEAAKAKAAEAAKEAKDKDGKKKGGAGSKVEKDKDMDPDGVQLAAVEAPLEEAKKHVGKLLAAAPDSAATHALAAEYYIRAGKIIPALKCAKRAHVLAPGSALAHATVVKVFLLAEAPAAPYAAVVAKIVADERKG
eukprot:CAMPEP_0182873838 /NCGR_PEP_ID=MMETSP0034_2-20130328/12564_1 /TAXON_ID=156128 /ORGANISM="Nephroselmis pyriformis, Strain CCMP717" /LENGTH=757 /DNA_ID=CAMNT_0025006513 /DNA_START=71 /DNA_END=2340 /DNA_ORIENTATION=-